MPKLKPDEISGKVIHEFITDGDDFGFELECLRELTARKVVVDHGGTYSDPITRKNRQFDFQIHVVRPDRRCVSIALECKNLGANFPLVVSRVPRRTQESFHRLLIPDPEKYVGSGMISIPRVRWNSCATTTLKGSNSCYPEGEMVGKSTTQIGHTVAGEIHAGDSEVHDKWSQALGSAYGLMERAAEILDDDDESGCPEWFVLPVMVVPDGVLWVVDYDAKGQLVHGPKRVDSTTFYLGHSPWQQGQRFEYTISHLHFVTISGMRKLVDDLVGESTFADRVFPTAD